MKILLVIPTMKQGGAERVISELANFWAEEGHSVTLVLLVQSAHFYVLSSKIEIIELGFENHGKINKIINEVKLFLVFRKLIKEKSADFILSFMEKYNIFTLISTIGLNQNVYVSDRSNPKGKVPFLVERLRILTYPLAKGIIAQTVLAQEVLFSKTKNENIKVISNPLKTITSYPEIKREKIILNVGRLHPLKGQEILLEIFSMSKLDDWKLVVLGDGELLESLTLKAKELNIEDKVIFLGKVQNVDEWLARASIFSFTSLSEGFPNALAEAMSSGLPCISFDCETGPSELIIDGKNGFLIPLKNKKIFIEKLELLVSNQSLRVSIGNEAKKIGEELRIATIAKKYLSFCSSPKMKVTSL